MKNYLKLSRVNKTVKRSPTQVNQLIIYASENEGGKNLVVLKISGEEQLTSNFDTEIML